MMHKSIKYRLTKGLQLLLVAVLVAGLSTGAWAVQSARAITYPPILDQSFTSPTNLGTAINECCKYVAQIFSPGLNGPLAGITLDVISSSSFPLHVAIRTVENGLPGPVTLGETTLSSSDASPTQLITFPNEIHVFAVSSYAIVVDYADAPEPGPYQAQGSWSGATGDVYPNGGAYVSSDGFSWLPVGSGDVDLHFQTYANIVMYQSDLAIKHVSGPKSAKACETFTETYTITNLGPDFARNVNVGVIVPDAFDVTEMQGVPVNLEVGESATITAVIKVVAFVPTESRKWRLTAGIYSEIYPDTNVDVDLNNNEVSNPITLTGKHRMLCP
jgi:hypothetical protein